MKKDFSENKTEYTRGKVLNFDGSPKRYMSLTEKRMEKEDLLGALSAAFSGYNKKPSAEALSDIADIYADMGQYELSNRYWYKYLAKAPKDKQTIAYEELAINYFYMGKRLLSGYYFNLKITEDGFLSRDNIDTEIIEFFDKSSGYRSKYRVVYPEERIDWSLIMKEGKKLETAGDFSAACKKYVSVPSTYKDYKKAREELCLCLFLAGEDEEATKQNKRFIEEFGPDVSIYCNLSEIYRLKGDREKSGYYYQKAVEVGAFSEETSFKLAACAIENKDYKTAITAFERVIDDNFFDVEVLLLYAAALLSCGETERAYNVYSKAYRIDPLSPVCAYYAEYSLRLKESGGKNCLLITNPRELPKEEIKKRVSRIIEVYDSKEEKIVNAFKDRKFCDYIRWAIREVHAEVVEMCIKLLFMVDTPKSREILTELLLDPLVPDGVKEMAMYISVLCGIKKKTAVCIGGFFAKSKPGYMMCESDREKDVFFKGYATVYSKMVTAGKKCLDNVNMAADRIYYKLRNKVLPEDLTKYDVAALIIYESELGIFRNKTDVFVFLGERPARFEELEKMYQEDNNG